MKKYLAVFVLFILPACVNTEQQRAQQAELQQRQAAFKQTEGKKYRECQSPPLTRGNAIEIEECRNSVFSEFTKANRNPDWIVNKYTAANLASATAYSEGEITAKKLKVQLASNLAQFTQDKNQATEQARQIQQQQVQEHQLAEEQKQRCLRASSVAMLAPQPDGNPWAALAAGWGAEADMGCP